MELNPDRPTVTHLSTNRARHCLTSFIEANANDHGSVFCRTKKRSYCRSKFYIAGTGIFDLFGSCDLDLDPMTLIYELDPYSLAIYRMCEYELPKSRLSKVIV